jgi:hypothetical protein
MTVEAECPVGDMPLPGPPQPAASVVKTPQAATWTRREDVDFRMNTANRPITTLRTVYACIIPLEQLPELENAPSSFTVNSYQPMMATSLLFLFDMESEAVSRPLDK